MRTPGLLSPISWVLVGRFCMVDPRCVNGPLGRPSRPLGGQVGSPGLIIGTMSRLKMNTCSTLYVYYESEKEPS